MSTTHYIKFKPTEPMDALDLLILYRVIRKFGIAKIEGEEETIMINDEINHPVNVYHFKTNASNSSIIGAEMCLVNLLDCGFDWSCRLKPGKAWKKYLKHKAELEAEEAAQNANGLEKEPKEERIDG